MPIAVDGSLPPFSGRGLACLRGERLVFAGLSFRVESGQALVVSGANGSGKSSLLRVMAGLTPSYEGWLGWGEEPIAADPDGHRRRVAYLGHQDAVKLAFTVAENLRFWLAYGGADAGRAEIERVLARLDLARLLDTPARYLSQGQRRRLALARVIGGRAPLWLLDEPANGLDDASVGLLIEALARHREEGGMVVAALHGELALGSVERLVLARAPVVAP
jgi:heme exporter protein A